MWVLYSYSFLYNTKPITTEIFPVGSGPDAEETTGKFIYAVTEILIDFINKTNDRSVISQLVS